MVKIRVPARLHITLIDLGAAGYRRNGGLGFTLETPESTFEFTTSAVIDLAALLHYDFKNAEAERISAILEKEQEIRGCRGIKLVTASVPSRHSGLGTGTATAMACVEAFCILNSIEMAPIEIIRLSGRGGASGIGVHGYFSGGLILDVGRAFDASPLVSSDSIVGKFAVPSQLVRLEFPKWRVGIFRLRLGSEMSLDTENALFSDLLPLPQELVNEVTYHSVFGVCAAILDGNYTAFCTAINAIQNCAWKAGEINLYGGKINEYMSKLRDLGCDAVGMSSVGPTIFFFASDFDAVFERIRSSFPEIDLSSAWPSNVGRTISYA